jgi:alkylhydroperoxidase family enzyme
MKTAIPQPPRIAPLDPPYPDGIRRDFDSIMRGAPPLTLFRTVARNPRVLSRMIAGGLLDRGSITIRARELMILRTTACCGAEYEWGVHVVAFGSKAGLTPEQIAATVTGDAQWSGWSREDALLIRLADALHASSDVDDALWQALSEVFAAEQLIELTMLAGLYHAVSFVARAMRLPPEPFAARFPRG